MESEKPSRYARRALDTPVSDPPAYHYVAATDIAPHGKVERELCAKASHPDWLYFLPLLALDVGSVWLDNALKFQDEPAVRLLGPSAVGFAWGATVGGSYLALPKCDMDFVRFSPPEGDVRPTWPVALSLALLAGATAPVIVGVETGALDPHWTTTERAMRLVLSGTTGFIGAFIPYLLPPKTWRAQQQLEKLRFGVTASGAMASYTLAF